MSKNLEGPSPVLDHAVTNDLGGVSGFAADHGETVELLEVPAGVAPGSSAHEGGLVVPALAEEFPVLGWNRSGL